MEQFLMQFRCNLGAIWCVSELMWSLWFKMDKFGSIWIHLVQNRSKQYRTFLSYVDYISYRNTNTVVFVVMAAAGNLNGNMYEVRKMRELRQPTLLSVFFVCIYSCPVSVLFEIGNAIGSSAIIRPKGQTTSKVFVIVHPWLKSLSFYGFDFVATNWNVMPWVLAWDPSH